MARVGDQTCLDVYIASRKQAVSTMMQVVATSVVVTVPTAAHNEKQIHECDHPIECYARQLAACKNRVCMLLIH